MSAAKYAPAKGAPPSIEFVEVFKLHVDETYQRTIETRDSRSIIGRIAAAWDWRLCSPLVVSRRLSEDGTGMPRLFVIDGQHRLAAARLRGDIAFVPCIITTYASAAEEAELFVAVNQRRRRVSPLETFRAVGFERDRLFRALLEREQMGWASAAMTQMAATGEAWPSAMKVVILRGYEAVQPDPVEEAA